ncbi:MAG: MmgE/PrpD family protein [Pollutimonas bauzanensis]
MSAHSRSLSDHLGRFVAETAFEGLPPPVVEKVKLRILDLLAASCSGVRANNHIPLLRLLPGDGDLVIWGTNERRSLRDATLINSAVAHSTYFEDGSRYTGGHPSSALIPAALNVAISRRADGRALIAAIAAGYEVFLRLGRAIYPSTVVRGFQSTAILAAPASAAAASSLLQLSETGAAHAISIACSQGAGLKEALKSANSQPLQVGRSSEGGLLAAMYAAQGAQGSPRALENGFLKAYAENADHGAIAPGLGSRWSIDETYIKQYGGCRGNHAAVDAVAEILSRHAIDYPAIEHIDIRVDTVTLAAAIEPPLNAEQAQFSIAFSVAVKIIKGDVLPNRFSSAALADPSIKALMRRIRVAADPALDADYPRHRPAIATLFLKDGRRITHRLDIAKGEPESPLTPDEIARKFEILAAPIFGASASSISEFVLSLESAKSMEPLNRLLAGTNVV